MAYENGDQIEDYFGDNIEKYQEDNLIFVKALAILNTYINRKDWPHCIEELEDTLNPILGCSLEFIGFRGSYFQDEYMKWSEDTPETYKRDVIAFYRTVSPIVMQYYYNRVEPMKLYSIVATNEDYGDSRKILRFIRNDGENLEVEFDRYSLDQAIQVLLELLERVDEG